MILRENHYQEIHIEQLSEINMFIWTIKWAENS